MMISKGRQTKLITGTIKDEIGNPVVGATIKVQGKQQGTINDAKGNFTLDVSPTESLVISNVNYQTQIVAVHDQKVIDIILRHSQRSLSEVVVVGYRKERAALVTGSVSQIGTKQITVIPQANVTHMLAGQLPGLIATQTSGIPGADDAALNVRCFGTPLVIVDGAESSLDLLDPKAK